MRTLLTVLVVVGLAACGSVPTSDTEDTLVGRLQDLAVESDGKLYVRYAGSGKPIVLIAQWPPDEAGAPAVRYRAARLEIQPTPVDVAAPAVTVENRVEAPVVNVAAPAVEVRNEVTRGRRSGHSGGHRDRRSGGDPES